MKVFLFPMVNVTLFPKTTKPLPIFEPRYIEMFRQAVATQTSVAIGFNDNPTVQSTPMAGQPLSYVREVAGYGSCQIVEERSNGTILVFVHGLGKVRLGNVVSSEHPFVVCEAEPILESTFVRPEMLPMIHGLNAVLARWIQTHIPDPGQRDLFVRSLSGPEEIIGAYTSFVIKDFDFQQLILELNDINEKVEYLHRLSQSPDNR